MRTEVYWTKNNWSEKWSANWMEREGKRGRMERRTKLPHACNSELERFTPQTHFHQFSLALLNKCFLSFDWKPPAGSNLEAALCQSQVKNAIANNWEIIFKRTPVWLREKDINQLTVNSVKPWVQPVFVGWPIKPPLKILTDRGHWSDKYTRV